MNTFETFLDFVTRLNREAARVGPPNPSPLMFAIDKTNVAQVAALLTLAEAMKPETPG